MEDGMLLSSVSLDTEITFSKLKQWWHPRVHLARLPDLAMAFWGPLLLPCLLPFAGHCYQSDAPRQRHVYIA